MTADIIKPIAVTRMEMPTKIPTVQADTGRKIIFVMTDLDIPKGGTAQIFAIKPSGAEVYNNCAVGNLSTGASTVEVKLTSAMLEEPGEFPAQVQVVSGEDVITTFEFIISNARSLIKKGVTEGTNEYNALIQATKDAEDAARAANEATKKADTAAEDANDAASAASRAEINANNASSVANSAAGAANATVGPAVNATEAANDAAKAANEAAKKAEAAAGGEISEKTVTFQEAVERANIESGDTLSVAFGKLAKYCADFEKVVENVNELNTKTKSKEMTAISAQGSNGWARYCIENGICFVNIELTPYSVEHDGPVCFPLPGAKYKNLLTFTLGTASGNCYCAYLRHTDNALCFYNPGYRTVERIDCTISYPVA